MPKDSLKDKAMGEIEEIFEELIKFRDERDWNQFHNPKDLAIALNVEANELLELFLWKRHEDVDLGKLKSELADVLMFSFYILDKYNLNPKDIILNKIEINRLKYPIDKSKGIAKKYDEL